MKNFSLSAVSPLFLKSSYSDRIKGDLLHPRDGLFLSCPCLLKCARARGYCELSRVKWGSLNLSLQWVYFSACAFKLSVFVCVHIVCSFACMCIQHTYECLCIRVSCLPHVSWQIFDTNTFCILLGAQTADYMKIIISKYEFIGYRNRPIWLNYRYRLKCFISCIPRAGPRGPLCWEAPRPMREGSAIHGGFIIAGSHGIQAHCAFLAAGDGEAWLGVKR